MSKEQYRIGFACGGSLLANKPKAVGARVLVASCPNEGHRVPKIDGTPCPCMLGCPTVKPAKRKVGRGWNEDGKRATWVSCCVTKCERAEA